MTERVAPTWEQKRAIVLDLARTHVPERLARYESDWTRWVDDCGASVLPLAGREPGMNNRELYGFTLGTATRLWQEGLSGDHWKQEVRQAARDYLHNTLGQHHSEVHVEWFGLDVVDVLITERSAVDLLAELSATSARKPTL